eukprot:2790185-Amphidinium_carterae.1
MVQRLQPNVSMVPAGHLKSFVSVDGDPSTLPGHPQYNAVITKSRNSVDTGRTNKQQQANYIGGRHPRHNYTEAHNKDPRILTGRENRLDICKHIVSTDLGNGLPVSPKLGTAPHSPIPITDSLIELNRIQGAGSPSATPPSGPYSKKHGSERDSKGKSGRDTAMPLWGQDALSDNV